MRSLANTLKFLLQDRHDHDVPCAWFAFHPEKTVSNMKIKEVRLSKFKRFTDTKITSIPESAKLIVIAGPNGCGKSSFFEALNVWSRAHGGKGLNWDATYYNKAIPGAAPTDWPQAVQIECFGEQKPNYKKSIYIRSAYRNDPEFQLSALNRLGAAIDEQRLNRIIENDATVSKNYQRLAAQAMQDVFGVVAEL